MKKIILTLLFIGIFVSPISASAMNKNQVEEQYRQAIIQVIELLMQKIEALILELEGMQIQSIPTNVLVEEKIEEKVEEEPVKWVRPWVRPPSDYRPATPIDRCHAPGQLDIKVKCE